MRDTFLRLYVKAQVLLTTLKNEENGQDLIEYALVVALIALAATTGMNALAAGINAAFGNIANRLNAAVA
jgi:pilus assembly protein Flp/PilA